MSAPILYTFRRCPYAIRARMALHCAGIQCEQREVLLKDKPQAMLDLSAKGTVPILLLDDGEVIDESIEIMHWALVQSDPQGWLRVGTKSDLVDQNDGYFKKYLDRYKYFERYPQYNQQHYLQKAAEFLLELEGRLTAQTDHDFLHGQQPTWVDVAIFPFVRQFAFVDLTTFTQLPLPRLQAWLDFFLTATMFTDVMEKFPTWQPPLNYATRKL